MKRFFTLISTLLLFATMSFAQTGGDKSTLNPQPLPPGRHPNTATTKSKKGHKGGKKGKKGSGTNTGTTTPK